MTQPTERSQNQIAAIATDPSTFVMGGGEGTTIGGYRLLGPLGSGGMGSLFRAEHRKLKKVVALKVIRLDHQADQEAICRFSREIEALGQLHHEHIVQAFDAGEASGITYLAMELIEGCDVETLCQCHGRVPWRAAGEIIRQTALGLQHAHDRGFLHRDIKPSNLLVNAQGIVKIADLGLARFAPLDAGEALTESNQIIGTADYLSPEQACGSSASIGVRSDLYSLGCTLYRMIAGKVPFPAPLYDTRDKKIVAHATKQPQPLEDICSDVPVPLLELVDQLLQKKPGLRVGSAAEVAAVLQQLDVALPLELVVKARQWQRPAQNEAVQATRPFSTTHRKPKSQPSGMPIERPARWRYLAVGIGGGLVAGLLATIGVLQNRGNSPDAPRTKQSPSSSAALPFDDRNVATQQPSGRWFDLLGGAQPVPLFWPAHDTRAKRLFEPELEQLTLNCPQLGLVSLAHLQTATYDFRADFHQSGWPGEFGVYWGARRTTVNGRPGWTMQLLSFRNQPRATPPKCIVLRSVLSVADHDRDAVQRLDHMEDEAPLLVDPEKELRMQLSPLGLVDVRWEGRHLAKLCDPELNAMADLADCRGELGVYLEQSNCVISRARVMRSP